MINGADQVSSTLPGPSCWLFVFQCSLSSFASSHKFCAFSESCGDLGEGSSHDLTGRHKHDACLKDTLQGFLRQLSCPGSHVL